MGLSPTPVAFPTYTTFDDVCILMGRPRLVKCQAFDYSVVYCFFPGQLHTNTHNWQTCAEGRTRTACDLFSHAALQRSSSTKHTLSCLLA